MVGKITSGRKGQKRGLHDENRLEVVVYLYWVNTERIVVDRK